MSGIITSRSAAARIVPVRIPTQAVDVAQNKLNCIASDFSSEFSAWLKLPAVRPAVREFFEKMVAAQSDSGFDTQVFELFAPFSQIDVYKNSPDFVVINELAKEIKYVRKWVDGKS